MDDTNTPNLGDVEAALLSIAREGPGPVSYGADTAPAPAAEVLPETRRAGR